MIIYPVVDDKFLIHLKWPMRRNIQFFFSTELLLIPNLSCTLQEVFLTPTPAATDLLHIGQTLEKVFLDFIKS